ncbi:dihydrolipoyl dehydrogenase family protein [Salinibius halmophilus]|uniref:dihydrolipoyl dehydrogenase family protein n=1 Tax=Salinibius halmophilus TaxID=1853216 RepID=UPI000E67586F|nr:NAD(P)/FAD-dependent oxidoreductase [Salinibius halmophilus]
MKQYDIVVIGSGAAGLTSGFTAAGFGKKVLMVDKALPGGECTWSGCIPSKALINQAKNVHAANKLGAAVHVDGAKVFEQVRGVSEHVYTHETPEVLAKAGIDFIQGAAKFIDSHTIEISGANERVKAKKFMLATGSSPLVPPIPGLADVPFLTNESLFQLTELPQSLTILGGGVIALEMAQAFNRLGTKVTVVEMQAEVLPLEEPEMAAKLRELLEAEGVEFKLSSKAIGVANPPEGIEVTIERGANTEVIVNEKLLVALGRSPNTTGMGLDDIGVEVDRFVKVNAKMQTSLPHIYAFGDVAGPYLLSHMANYQGKLATMNALLPFKRSVNYEHVTWATFTDPEFARAGLTEAQAREKYGDSIRVYRYNFDKLDRAHTKQGDFGEIKLIIGKRNRVLGAHILAERAGEMISQVQTMKTLGIPFSKLQKVIHPYPTYSDALRQLSQTVFLDGIFQNPVVKLFRKG